MSHADESGDFVVVPPPGYDGEASVHESELEDRRVASPFILAQRAKLEDRTEAKGELTRSSSTDEILVSSSPEANPVKSATKTSECGNVKLPRRDLHSLAQSISAEVTEPIVSEVDDDGDVDQSNHTEESSEKNLHALHSTLEETTRRTSQDERSDVRDDYDGDADFDHTVDSHVHGSPGKKTHKSQRVAEEIITIGSGNERSKLDNGDIKSEGEIRSESGNFPPHSYDPLFEEKSTPSPDERAREPRELEDLEFSSQPSKPQDKSTDAKSLDSGSPNRSNPEEFDTPSSELEKTEKEIDFDALSYLEKSTQEKEVEEDQSTQRSRLDSKVIVFYPLQLNPEEIINPFSLEDRIRKAREDQDFALLWDLESIDGITEIVDDSLLSEDITSPIPELEEIPSDQRQADSAENIKGFEESGFLATESKERRRRTESLHEELVDEEEPSSTKKTGAGDAILLGALASGVNKQTWFAIRAVLVMLVASLGLLLHAAIYSGNSLVVLNVVFLIAIAGGLILLLNWFISQIGLVSVEKQMSELNLTIQPIEMEKKTL